MIFKVCVWVLALLKIFNNEFFQKEQKSICYNYLIGLAGLRNQLISSWAAEYFAQKLSYELSYSDD